MRTHSFSAQNKNGEASYIPLVAFETWYPVVSGDLATHSKTKNNSDLRELTVPPGRSRHAVLKKITERSRP